MRRPPLYHPSSLAAAVAAAALLAACAVPPPSGQPTAAALARPSAPKATVLRTDPAPALYELAYSPSLHALFVTSAGGFHPDSPPPKLLRLNPQTLAVEREIPLPYKGFGLALDEAGGRLYIGNTVDASITAVDIRSNTVIGTLPLLDRKIINKDGREVFAHHLRELRVDPASHRLYAPGLSVDVPSVLFVVDTRSFKLEKVVDDLGGAATGVALDPAGKRVFVSNLGGEIYTIDTDSLTVTGRMRSPADQPMNLAYDATTRRLLVTDQGAASIRDYQQRMVPGFVSTNSGNRLLVLDADSGKEVASVATGEAPISVLLDAARRRAYVTNRMSGTVTALDADNYGVLDRVVVTPHPNSLALDAQRNVVYVSVKGDPKNPSPGKEGVARLQY